MQIKMKGILASPDLCADADSVISVGSEFGQSLIEGNYAQETSAFAAPETTSMPVSARAQIFDPTRATDEQIQEILEALDTKNADHWLVSGKPNPEVVRELTGDLQLTSAEISERFPEFRHPAFKEAVGEIVDAVQDAAKADENATTSSETTDGDGETKDEAASTDDTSTDEKSSGEDSETGEVEKSSEAPAKDAPAPKSDAKPATKTKRQTRSSAP